MAKSERLLRVLDIDRSCECENVDKSQQADWKLEENIMSFFPELKDNRDINFVDAIYFDFSVLPERIKDERWQDQYLGLVMDDNGNLYHKWIDRHHFDHNLGRDKCCSEEDLKKDGISSNLKVINFIENEVKKLIDMQKLIKNDNEKEK